MVLGQDTPDGMVGITSMGDDGGSSMGMKTVAVWLIGLWVALKVFG